MNIIMLSGGSGKRLWPLSNDIRSKQFLRLFRNDRGEPESMVQRVYRQITEIYPHAQVTIATSKSQASTIHTQLGDKVSVCVEPCRKDTFPAIVLAAAYLHDEKGVGEEECIIVCPIDPYVTNDYFEALRKLEELVKNRSVNIALMGIAPTYPSDKYGYIIPGDMETVREFKEKPSAEEAVKYIEDGALWNAGVFAFKLGYLLDKARSMLNTSDYNSLLRKYTELEKISFDYAVVEKETNIKALRFKGAWKDIGTWNTLTEVMMEPVNGNAILDSGCLNTQVINELDIPVLCMGCTDMVIAASCDGILVANKEQSSYMKPYVEKFNEEIRFAEKSWGTYRVIDVQPGSMTIKVTLRAGNRMKYHSHKHRDEVWTVVEGRGRTIIDGVEQEVHVGDMVNVGKDCKHTLIADTDMNVIEIQIGKDISQTDKKVFQQP